MARTELARNGSARNGFDRAELIGIMGCRGSVTVVGVDDPAHEARLLGLAEHRLRALESRWSRFLDGSEISRLATAEGRALPVSAPTRTLVRALVDAWRATGGAFDPTRLAELVAQGYATSVLDPAHVTTLPTNAVHAFDPDRIEIDEDAGTVRLPVGATLDPGGLGKGLAADLVTAELLDRGAAGAMVEIGGDLRVAGLSPSGPGWRIAVDDPQDPTGSLATIDLADGGIATSSRLYRRWLGPDGDERHHLLDPRTGRPVTSDVVAATVVTATGAWSDAFSKVPMVLGADAARDALDAASVAGLFVRFDGSVVTTRGWAAVAR